MGAVPAWRKDPSPEEEPSVQRVGEHQKAERLRRYSVRVTIAMIILCNAVFLLGIWASGVNLDGLVKTPDLFNPVQDICLRLSWHKVSGDDQPVRLCAEWINLSDPSGNTHSFQKETEVVKGGDGKLYFNHGQQVDYRLFVFGGFVVAIFSLGVVVRRHLIRRYQTGLETEP
jgi:hypothetical protein